ENVVAMKSDGRAPTPSLSHEVRPTATWSETRLVGRTSRGNRMPTTATRPMHVPTTSPLTGNGAAAQDELLRVDNLQVHFPIVQGVCRRQVGTLRAVDGVSFSIKH